MWGSTFFNEVVTIYNVVEPLVKSVGLEEVYRLAGAVVKPEYIIHDLLVSIPLFVLVVLVVYVFSRIVYHLTGSNYKARKFIHFAAGAVAAVLAPYLFYTPFVFVLMSFILFLIVYFPHKKGSLLYWFQIEKKYGEVYFTFAYFALFSIFWYIDINIAIASALFMAIGDGVTGLIKERYYGRREEEKKVKGFNLGNVAMMIVSVPIGYYYCGVAGAIAAVFVSILESFEGIDDNVTIPFGAAAMISLLKLFGL